MVKPGPKRHWITGLRAYSVKGLEFERFGLRVYGLGDKGVEFRASSGFRVEGL